MIRRACLDDAAAIAAIYNESIVNAAATFDTEIKTVEDRVQWLEQHDNRHPVLVAAEGEKILGWASLSKWSDRHAYDDTVESSVYIHREHRGLGIGRQLMQALIEEAKTAKLHTIIARIAGESMGSIRLHEQLGFAFVGTMKEVGRKFGRLHDVHLYQLLLY